jgi:hypothetical protein
MSFRETEFTITEDHMKLLNRMYIGWEDCEFGAPAVDCKRPYGNSYVYGDIAEILGIKGEVDLEDNEWDFSEDQKAEMSRLHSEMQVVLQILVKNAATGIKAGDTYVREASWSSDWEKQQ